MCRKIPSKNGKRMFFRKKPFPPPLVKKRWRRKLITFMGWKNPCKIGVLDFHFSTFSTKSSVESFFLLLPSKLHKMREKDSEEEKNG